MERIELRLMNENTDIYSIFFSGEIIGQVIISNLYKPYFCIKVCENSQEMEKCLNYIGEIFKATFYKNNVEIISGTPFFNGSDFKIYEKNVEPCIDYDNRERKIINL